MLTAAEYQNMSVDDRIDRIPDSYADLLRQCTTMCYDEVMATVKEKLELFFEGEGAADKFIRRLAKLNRGTMQAIIAGGSMSQVYYGKEWETDLDIFVTSTAPNDIVNRLLPSGYSLVDDESCYYGGQVATFKNKKGMKIQFILVDESVHLIEKVNMFDLDCCKAFYDGRLFYTIGELGTGPFTIDSRVYNKSDERAKKYAARGFKVNVIRENGEVVIY